MQNAIKITYYIILGVFVASAALCISGLAYVWFLQSPESAKSDLPYLGPLFSSLIIEAIGVVVMFAKQGMKYLPKVTTYNMPAETFKFMCDYIEQGTSVTIVSNRLTLLGQSDEFFQRVRAGAASGTQFEIITPKPIAEQTRIPLEKAGVVFLVTNETTPPEARFTLVNGHRAGAERLAIARGTHPDHEITIFDNDSGPQMIAMAKDIIRKSKALAHAA
jgi:hypothetical protein